MEAKRICPYCMGELENRVSVCPHCGGVLAGRNPAGSLPVGTLLAGRYTVGEMQSIDGEGILYRGVENVGRFRVTIKEYMPLTLSAERARTRCSGPSWAARCCSRPPGWTLPISTAPSSASPPQTVWRLCWTCSRRTTPSTP